MCPGNWGYLGKMFEFSCIWNHFFNSLPHDYWIFIFNLCQLTFQVIQILFVIFDGILKFLLKSAKKILISFYLHAAEFVELIIIFGFDFVKRSINIGQSGGSVLIFRFNTFHSFFQHVHSFVTVQNWFGLSQIFFDFFKLSIVSTSNTFFLNVVNLIENFGSFGDEILNDNVPGVETFSTLFAVWYLSLPATGTLVTLETINTFVTVTLSREWVTSVFPGNCSSDITITWFTIAKFSITPMAILASGTISATKLRFTFTLTRDLKEKVYWCGNGVVSYVL